MKSLMEEYRSAFPESARLYERAVRSIAGGVTHDTRFFLPFPLSVVKADGAYKWDVDNHCLLDYWMGHGSLLFGHAHPSIVAAVQEQAARGTHYGASHAREVEWAESILGMLPAADMVRFVSSGSEATQLALRVARAYTGRQRILKFGGHFHGWHDEAAAVGAQAATSGQAGVAHAAEAGTVLVPAGDSEIVDRTLDIGDIAAVLVEPSGGGWGSVPLPGEFLRSLAQICRNNGTLLIFDEVVTGFRLSAGGAQELYGVEPDLTCMAKIMAGGLPGGAIAGRRAVMELFEFRPDNPRWAERKVVHYGTFNANPLSAAAGVSALQLIQSESPYSRLNEMCTELVQGLNAVMQKHSVCGVAYGQSSLFHIAIGVEGLSQEQNQSSSAPQLPTLLQTQLLAAAKSPVSQALRRAMLLEGVDLMLNGGFISTAHTATDIERTLVAFERALGRLEISHEGR